MLIRDASESGVGMQFDWSAAGADGVPEPSATRAVDDVAVDPDGVLDDGRDGHDGGNADADADAGVDVGAATDVGERAGTDVPVHAGGETHPDDETDAADEVNAVDEVDVVDEVDAAAGADARDAASVGGAAAPAPDQRRFEQLYTTIRSLAHKHLHHERRGGTLHTTMIAHEVWLRLAEVMASIDDRNTFHAVASRTVRRTLIDHARRRDAARRGGGDWQRIPLEDGLLTSDEQASDLIDLESALRRLAARSPRQAEIVELRFFGGLTEQETASALGTSRATVAREWRWARAWLGRALHAPADDDGPAISGAGDAADDDHDPAGDGGPRSGGTSDGTSNGQSDGSTDP